eukprot:3865251-Prorocentrum_lima.AAC.1
MCNQQLASAVGLLSGYATGRWARGEELTSQTHKGCPCFFQLGCILEHLTGPSGPILATSARIGSDYLRLRGGWLRW